MNLEILLKLQEEFNTFKGNTTSQLGQDIIARILSGNKNNGYFVEFGALDGKKDSNTYILEKELNWKGILAEPGKIFHFDINRNRNCHIDYRAVTDKTGQLLDFKETHAHLGLSGLVDYVFACGDEHVPLRKQSAGETYKVESVCLNDLLKTYDAPYDIDYMSIDTEGSEPIILESFDFSHHQIKFITVEHNYVEKNRQRIKEVLFANGYKRIMHDISKIDDWFILERLF